MSPPRAKQRVALTGAASFLGQNLIGLLEDDPRFERIVSLDITPPATRRDKTAHVDCDLTRPQSVELISERLREHGVETLVHLAFLSSPSHTEVYAHELESVGTMHALTGARGAGVSKLVAWSQTMLYGALPSNPNFLTEDHPLSARRGQSYFADKIEAEAEARRFAATGATVTILRTAPILGPTVRNYLTRYLAARVVPTLMGFDPLLQLVHEVDALAAFKHALLRDVAGTFNVAGDGVLPLSTVVKLAGRIAVPLPGPLASRAVSALWMAGGGFAPSSFLEYLRFVCVADNQRAKDVLGFAPAFPTREAVLDFAAAQHLRDVRLISDPLEAR